MAVHESNPKYLIVIMGNGGCDFLYKMLTGVCKNY